MAYLPESDLSRGILRQAGTRTNVTRTKCVLSSRSSRIQIIPSTSKHFLFSVVQPESNDKLCIGIVLINTSELNVSICLQTDWGIVGGLGSCSARV